MQCSGQLDATAAADSEGTRIVLCVSDGQRMGKRTAGREASVLAHGINRNDAIHRYMPVSRPTSVATQQCHVIRDGQSHDIVTNACVADDTTL